MSGFFVALGVIVMAALFGVLVTSLRSARSPRHGRVRSTADGGGGDGWFGGGDSGGGWFGGGDGCGAGDGGGGGGGDGGGGC